MSVRLVRLEVENFKSYGGNVSIGPFLGFTSVVGPNGSGKSNLMDAISFVLGVRTNQLRGNSLGDLVFHAETEGREGEEGREGDDEGDDEDKRAETSESGQSSKRRRRGGGRVKAPLAGKRAFVRLVLLRQEDEREMVFMREITGSGSSSEYSIDGEVVSLERYNEVLASVGIFVKARNFLVFQNEVQSIATNSAKGLTAMFEQISGSAELKDEYEDAKADKEKTEEQSVFCFRKKKNMAVERRQYKEQREEAEKFRSLKQQLDSCRTDRALFELYHIQQDQAKMKEDLGEKKDTLEGLEADKTVREAEYNEKRRVTAGAHRRVTLIEKEIGQATSELEARQPKEEKAKALKDRIGRRLKSTESEIQKLETDRRERLSTLGKLQDALRDIEGKLQTIDEEIDATSAERPPDEVLEEYRSLKKEAALLTSALQQELESTGRSERLASELRLSIQASISDLEKRKVSLEGEKAVVEDTVRNLRVEEVRTRDQLSRLSTNHDEFLLDMQKKEERRRELEKVANDASEKLREAKADLSEGTRERKMSDAIAAMKRLFPGVRGRLTDLCTPQDKYREAVAVICGKMMDAVVVDHERTASECIAYLKEQRIGTAMFLPLNDLRPAPIDERLRQFGGSAQLAIDVLNFGEEVFPAVQYATSNSLVCDTLEEARHIRFERGRQVKICSIDGSLIDKSGFMTGGASRSDGQRARKWDRKDIDTLKTKRDAVVEELNGLGSSDRDRERVQDLKSQVQQASKRLDFVKMDLRAAQEKLARIDNALNAILTQKTAKDPELREASENVDQAKAKLLEVRSRLGSTEETVFGDFAPRNGAPTVEAFERKFIHSHEALMEERVRLVKHRMAIVSQIQYEESREESEKVAEAKQREKILELKQSLDEVTDELDIFERERSSMDKKRETLKKNLDEAMKNYEKLRDESKARQNELKTALHNIAENNKVVLELGAEIENLDEKWSELIGRCEVEQIELPYVDTSAEGGTSLHEDEVESGHGRKREIDFSVLGRKLRESCSEAERIEFDRSFVDQERSLCQEIEKLAPNMRASEHMSDVEARLAEVNQEFEDAREAAAASSQRFETVKLERHRRFMLCFNHVSSRIAEIYGQLTQSSHGAVGGSAYLSLESPDEPYLSGVKFNAMPPSKRFRDMEQLSGGERTVAALALLFAIHDYRPSPFFVLDEVDSALDNANGNKVSNYIRARSKELQTIVISLRESFFEKSEALIGVYKDVRSNTSRILTLNLSSFSDDSDIEA